jgi:hypothetical protein
MSMLIRVFVHLCRAQGLHAIWFHVPCAGGNKARASPCFRQVWCAARPRERPSTTEPMAADVGDAVALGVLGHAGLRVEGEIGADTVAGGKAWMLSDERHGKGRALPHRDLVAQCDAPLSATTGAAKTKFCAAIFRDTMERFANSDLVTRGQRCTRLCGARPPCRFFDGV